MSDYVGDGVQGPGPGLVDDGWSLALRVSYVYLVINLYSLQFSFI